MPCCWNNLLTKVLAWNHFYHFYHFYFHFWILTHLTNNDSCLEHPTQWSALVTLTSLYSERKDLRLLWHAAGCFCLWNNSTGCTTWIVRKSWVGYGVCVDCTVLRASDGCTASMGSLGFAAFEFPGFGTVVAPPFIPGLEDAPRRLAGFLPVAVGDKWWIWRLYAATWIFIIYINKVFRHILKLIHQALTFYFCQNTPLVIVPIRNRQFHQYCIRLNINNNSTQQNFCNHEQEFKVETNKWKISKWRVVIFSSIAYYNVPTCFKVDSVNLKQFSI